MATDQFPVRWITDQIAISYAPRSHADIEAIKASGIDAVLNLSAECYDCMRSSTLPVWTSIGCP